MKSHILYRLHSALSRVVHLALRSLSWLRQLLARAVAFIKNTIFMVFLVSLLTGCHTSRHVITHVDEASVGHSGHQEQTVSSRLDSLFSQLTASADSITMVLYGNAIPSAVLSGFASTLPFDSVSAASCGSTYASTYGSTSELYVPASATLQDSASTSSRGNVPSSQLSTVAGTFLELADHLPTKARITIHSPRINKEIRSGSISCMATNVADSTRSNTEAHTSTDDSKESIGGAEPPNFTWVFIVLGLGITLLVIGAVFGYMLLHKKGLL